MTEKNKKNSSYDLYEELIAELKKEQESKVQEYLNKLNKNKDILLQVRLDEEYDKKISILENMLNKNRSEVIRKAIDNLLENSICENEKVNKNNLRNNLRKEREQEEIITLAKYLTEIYKSTNAEKLFKLLETKIDTLEELKK